MQQNLFLKAGKMSIQLSKPRLKNQLFLLLLILWGATLPSLSQAFQPQPQQKDPIPLLVLTPRFENCPIATEVPGAPQTMIAPAFLPANHWNEKLIFPQPTWQECSSHTWQRFIPKAQNNLNRLLERLHPHLIRDQNHIVQMIVLQSESPLTASTLLAPSFGSSFYHLLGPDIIAVAPTPYRLYLFTDIDSALTPTMAHTLLNEYLNSSDRLSREVLEISHQQIQGKGRLEDIKN